MKNHGGWWKLYGFIALACVVLFGLISSSTDSLILWVVVVYGVMAIWLRDEYAHSMRVPIKKPPMPVEEFFDADRQP